MTNVFRYKIGGENLWKILCDDYLTKEPQWDEAIRIIESYGISSSDAMIINMFLCTKFLFLLTSDKEIANIVKDINDNKFVIVPNGIKLDKIS